MADVDGDGRLDLVAGSDNCCDSEPGFYWFARGPDGRWAARPKVRVDVATKYPLFMARFRVALGDLDGDGRTDVAAWLSEGETLRLARGPFKPGSIIPATEALRALDHPLWTRPCLADWDQDGRLDLIIGVIDYDQPTDRWTSKILWHRNLGGGRMADPAELLAFERPDSIEGLEVADWDADGWPDLLVGVEVAAGPKAPENLTTVGFRVDVYTRKASGPDRPEATPPIDLTRSRPIAPR